MRSCLHIFAAAAVFSLTACQLPDRPTAGSTVEATASEQAVISVLRAQQAAWNAGDIDGFMQGYWQSPELRFASGGSVTRGYEATLARYHKRYSNRSEMGQLNFDDLEVHLLGQDAAVVHGAWRLQREADEPSGLFTLIFRRIGPEWKIVSDTTTSAD